MAKEKNVFFCKECGYESAKWLGQCPGCHEWNTFTDAPKPVRKKGSGVGTGSGMRRALPASKPEFLSHVDSTESELRIATGIGELDRVLGGGIVKGSMVLVGGDPGIGKSTLLLQMCSSLAKKKQDVLYVSGEESLHQIKMRAARLGEDHGDFRLLSETNLDEIEALLEEEKPEIVIVDSIQTMYCEEATGQPGSMSQVKESTGILMRLAKQYGISIFIVGHVTKEGTVAGPRMLEHMVDTVLYFEGDNNAAYRMLRGVKNRFGSTNEIGVFEMRREGLREVANPSEYMLQGRPKGEPGSVVMCSIEGTRPILIEIQALICQTNFNMPRRTAAGTDYNRVNLLMAVLEKRLGISMASCDGYVNVAGGMRVVEPALDLGIVAAIISSYRNRAIDEGTILFGEVGLTGEVRGVSWAAKRVSEAEKMGYTTCILPEANYQMLMEEKQKTKITLIGIRNLRELMEHI